MSKLIDLREAKASVARFVGATSPSVCPNDCVGAVYDATRRLLADGVDYLFINTDGWIENGGIEHKLLLLETIGADLVVLLGLSVSTL